jgi:large subunit ribosomal protein L23
MAILEKAPKKASAKTAKEAPAKKEAKPAKQSENRAKVAYRVLVKPLITEKASVAGTLNKYSFVVSLDANKVEISKAIEEVYGVKPVRVNVVRMEGKAVRTGRFPGKRKDWKKAIVTLPEGKTIQIYEGV